MIYYINVYVRDNGTQWVGRRHSSRTRAITTRGLTESFGDHKCIGLLVVRMK